MASTDTPPEDEALAGGGRRDGAGRTLKDGLAGFARWVGHPYALGLLGVFSGVWLLKTGVQVGWQGVLAISTMISTIVIQASQNRDTAALHAKLDELIAATPSARNELEHLEDRNQREIDAARL